MSIEAAMSAIIDYRGKTPTKTDAGVPLVTAKVVKGGRVLDGDREYVAVEDYDEWMRRGLPQAGDIVVTTEAPLGEVAQLDGSRVALAQRLITLRPRPGVIESDFLLYAMQSKFVQEQLRARATGTTVHGIKQSELRKVVLPVPPANEQIAIGSSLRVLDKLIDANSQMNRTLEALARALFRSWFVDFDPVRAKMEGRPTGLPDDVAAVFPDRLVESTIGKIPQGWKPSVLAEVIDILDSKRIPLSGKEREQRKGPYPYYGAASMMDSVDDFLFDGIYVLIGEDGSVVMPDDRPVLQYVWGKFWVNNHAHVLRGKNGVGTEQLYLFLQTVNIRPFVTGAVQPKLNQGNLNRVPFVLPPHDVSSAFSTLIAPLFARYRANVEQSRTLASLREALLPKLMSGELSVPVSATKVGP